MQFVRKWRLSFQLIESIFDTKQLSGNYFRFYLFIYNIIKNKAIFYLFSHIKTYQTCCFFLFAANGFLKVTENA